MSRATSNNLVSLMSRPPSDAPQATASNPVVPNVKRIGCVAAQIVLLLLLNKLGGAVVEGLGVPFPGTVAGLVLLFAALSFGVIRLSWVEEAAALLTRHLAFFFIPIAVGLMTFGELLFASGAALLIALAVSAAVGIAVTGGVAQLFTSKDRTGTPQ